MDVFIMIIGKVLIVIITNLDFLIIHKDKNLFKNFWLNFPSVRMEVKWEREFNHITQEGIVVSCLKILSMNLHLFIQMCWENCVTVFTHAYVYLIHGLYRFTYLHT